MTRPRLLFYCQHSLGLGHLVRSLALAEALAARFGVVLLNGGRFPAGFAVPAGVDVIDLVPLGHDEHHRLVSHDPAYTVDAAKRSRTDDILSALDRVRPEVVLVELYPFGRNKFDFELGPLLRRARSLGRARPRVVCSVRDILVGRRDEGRHDDRACARANEYLDAILVHADPTFARLEESFRPTQPLRVPVHYTGFVAPPTAARPTPQARLPRVIVSAGGGMVGGRLFDVAVDAHRRIHDQTGLTMFVVAGPFAPEPVWNRLVAQAAVSPHLHVVRRVDDLGAEIARSAVSVSQGGYNTTMDLLGAGTPAVVIPYAAAGEDEQQRRAQRLDAMGILRCIDGEQLDPVRLADEVGAALVRAATPTTLDMTGRETSARIVAEIAGVGGG